MTEMSHKAPAFICIGPEKTGTTLLYSMLKEHPQVRLPPVKELRYWDEGYNVPPHSISQVLTSHHWHYELLRKRLQKVLKSELKRIVALRWREETDFYWWFNYILGRRSSDWYEGLFSQKFISGDYRHCIIIYRDRE